MLVTFGPWRPDLTDLDSGCTDAINVVPDVDSYAPQPSLVTFTSPLPTRCQGAISIVDAAGSVYWFAGDRNHLYIINSNTTSWSDISRLTLPLVGAGGYAAGAGFGSIAIVAPGTRSAPARAAFGVPSLSRTLAPSGLGAGATLPSPPIITPRGYAAPFAAGLPTAPLVPPSYSTYSTGTWNFAQYGDNIYATNFSDPIQVYSLASGTRFNNLGGSPPTAHALAVVKNFLVAVNTWDSVDLYRPQRVRWSGLDAPATWTVDSVTQADFQDLLGDGGANQTIVAALTQADAVILQERAVWRMTYQGLPSVFTFDLVEGVRGTPAPGSVIAVGGIVYYLGEDGFYAFDGAQSAPIGQGRINDTFLSEIDPIYYYRMSATTDISRKLIFWAYPTTSAVDGCPDRILAFNWSTGEWSRIDVPVELLWRTLTFGYTLEELDAFGDLDSLLASLDSRQWSGGVQQLSAFDPTHATAHFSGSNLAATITTREITTPDPRRTLVREAWPIIDCESATSAVRIGVGSRKHANDSVSYATSTLMNNNGFCPQRAGDHYIRFRMSITSSTVWTHAAAIDAQFTQVGWR